MRVINSWEAFIWLTALCKNREPFKKSWGKIAKNVQIFGHHYSANLRQELHAIKVIKGHICRIEYSWGWPKKISIHYLWIWFLLMPCTSKPIWATIFQVKPSKGYSKRVRMFCFLKIDRCYYSAYVIRYLYLPL